MEIWKKLGYQSAACPAMSTPYFIIEIRQKNCWSVNEVPKGKGARGWLNLYSDSEEALNSMLTISTGCEVLVP